MTSFRFINRLNLYSPGAYSPSSIKHLVLRLPELKQPVRALDRDNNRKGITVHFVKMNYFVKGP